MVNFVSAATRVTMAVAATTIVTVKDEEGKVIFGPQAVPIDRTMEYIVAQCPPRVDQKVLQLKHGETVLASISTLRDVFEGGPLDLNAVVLDKTESTMRSESKQEESESIAKAVVSGAKTESAASTDTKQEESALSEKRSASTMATTVPVGSKKLDSATIVTVRDTEGDVIFGPQAVPLDRTMAFIVAQCPPRADQRVPKLKYGETVLASSATLRDVFEGGSVDFIAVVLDEPEAPTASESKQDGLEPMSKAVASGANAEETMATETKQEESALPKKRSASTMATTVPVGRKKLDSAATVTVRDTEGDIIFGPQAVPLDRTMEYIVAQCPPRADQRVPKLKCGETVLASSETLRDVFEGGMLELIAEVLCQPESAGSSEL